MHIELRNVTQKASAIIWITESLSSCGHERLVNQIDQTVSVGIYSSYFQGSWSMFVHTYYSIKTASAMPGGSTLYSVHTYSVHTLNIHTLKDSAFIIR